MNLQLDLNGARFNGENHRLWQDGRVWWVNCVAVEAGWYPQIAPQHLSEARRRRDAMLAALIEVW